MGGELDPLPPPTSQSSHPPSIPPSQKIQIPSHGEDIPFVCGGLLASLESRSLFSSQSGNVANIQDHRSSVFNGGQPISPQVSSPKPNTVSVQVPSTEGGCPAVPTSYRAVLTGSLNSKKIGSLPRIPAISMAPKVHKLVDNKPEFFLLKEEYMDAAKYHDTSLTIKFSPNRPSLEKFEEMVCSHWGLSKLPAISIVNPKTFLMHFENREDFNKVWSKENKQWMNTRFFISRWSDESLKKKESPLSAVWIKMPGLPLPMFNPSILEGIGNSIGKFVAFDERSVRLKITMFARICVEMDVSQELPESILIWIGEDQFAQHIVYEDLPLFCSYCHLKGHRKESCRKRQKKMMKNIKKQRPAISEQAAASIVPARFSDKSVEGPPLAHTKLLSKDASGCDTEIFTGVPDSIYLAEADRLQANIGEKTIASQQLRSMTTVVGETSVDGAITFVGETSVYGETTADGETTVVVECVPGLTNLEMVDACETSLDECDNARHRTVCETTPASLLDGETTGVSECHSARHPGHAPQLSETPVTPSAALAPRPELDDVEALTKSCAGCYQTPPDLVSEPDLVPRPPFKGLLLKPSLTSGALQVKEVAQIKCPSPPPSLMSGTSSLKVSTAFIPSSLEEAKSALRAFSLPTKSKRLLDSSAMTSQVGQMENDFNTKSSNRRSKTKVKTKSLKNDFNKLLLIDEDGDWIPQLSNVISKHPPKFPMTLRSHV